MGNNNQERMSNVLGEGLFSADGPLYLWSEFMYLALNQPWEWNGGEPVGQTSVERPPASLPPKSAAGVVWRRPLPAAAR